jgi:hypothetical protein
VISRATASFRQALRSLSPAEQQAARRAYRLMADAAHNSLRFKKLAGHESLWSVRVTLSVRAVGHREGDTITWLWIGSHSEFDNKFS